jgi:hypothetical protein
VSLAAVLGGLAACGGATAPPSPTPPVVVPPIVHVVNTPPTIKSISIAVTRAEVDQDVSVTAEVEDAETAVDQLKYTWSANAGTLSGDGRTATWRLAKGAVATPIDVTITLLVTEKYQDVDDAGNPITRENKVSQDAPASLRVHDSVAELTRMGVTFLVDYFGDSSISPEACLVDFWDGCRGKSDELGDIRNNRNLYVQLSAKARVASINFFDAAKTSAEIWVPCEFEARDKATGVVGTASGDCYLTAVYEQKRWWLCDSNFCRSLTATAAEPWSRPFFLYCGGR